jgi:hypothetical protein
MMMFQTKEGVLRTKEKSKRPGNKITKLPSSLIILKLNVLQWPPHLSFDDMVATLSVTHFFR